MTPIELARRAREESPSSIAVPYSVTVYRRNGRGYNYGVAKGFEDLDAAERFFQGRHSGANRAELRAFNGAGYPIIRTR